MAVKTSPLNKQANLPSSKLPSKNLQQKKSESIWSIGFFVFLINATLVGIVVLILLWPKNFLTKKFPVIINNTTANNDLKKNTEENVKKLLKSTPTPVLLTPESYFESYKKKCQDGDNNFMIRNVLKHVEEGDVPLKSEDFKSQPKNPNSYSSKVKELCAMLADKNMKSELIESSDGKISYKLTTVSAGSKTYPFVLFDREWRFVINL